jgi:hypothetical protein
MTGGGAIVHAHEVTYSLLLPEDHPALRGLDVKAKLRRDPCADPCGVADVRRGDGRSAPSRSARTRTGRSSASRGRRNSTLLRGGPQDRRLGPAPQTRPRSCSTARSCCGTIRCSRARRACPTSSAARSTPSTMAVALRAAFADAFGPVVEDSITPEESALRGRRRGVVRGRLTVRATIDAHEPAAERTRAVRRPRRDLRRRSQRTSRPRSATRSPRGASPAEIDDVLLLGPPYGGVPRAILAFGVWKPHAGRSGRTDVSSLRTRPATGLTTFEGVYGARTGRVLRELDAYHPDLRAAIRRRRLRPHAGAAEPSSARFANSSRCPC